MNDHGTGFLPWFNISISLLEALNLSVYITSLLFYADTIWDIQWGLVRDIFALPILFSTNLKHNNDETFLSRSTKANSSTTERKKATVDGGSSGI